MAKIKALTADPRWEAFAKRYAFDAAKFAIEVCGMHGKSNITHQQLELFDSVSGFGSRTSVASGHGCFAAGTEIMLASGTVVPVEQIREGDRIMGADGNSYRTAIELKRGRESMYRFTYTDGTSHVFNESHILCLVATNSKGRRVAGQRTEVTVREWLTWGADKKRCHAIYRQGVESFRRSSTALPIPAYVFGAWLGDGDSRSAIVTTEDFEIVDALSEWAASIGCRLSVGQSNSGNAQRYHVTNGRMGPNQSPALTALRSLGVLNNKYIPDAYLFASKRDRLDLLAALIDTDGSLDKAGYDFIQKNERLARQVAWLARSVGCHATVREVTKTCSNNGVSGQYWRVTIGRNVDQIPVRVERKKRPEGSRQRDKLNFGIKSCEPLGEGDYYGFVLDGDNRFLGGDFTVLHNTGKTRSFAVIALWHLLCYADSNTYLTAPKLATLQEGIWKEFSGLKEVIEQGPHAWIAEYFEIKAKKVFVKGAGLRWFITCRTAPRGSPEGMAGTHGAYLLWLADEASGIPDANMNVISGALTDKRNRFALASQPTRSSGFFYDTHHKLSTENGGPWTSLIFNSEDSPIVSDEFIRDKALEYGGEDSVEYQIKVQGRFPEHSDKYLVSRKSIERCVGKSVIGADEAYGNLLLVDVGAGVYRDRTVVTHAKVIGYGGPEAVDPRRVEFVKIPVYSNTRDWTDVAGMVAHLSAGLSNCTVLVDVGGQGEQFAKLLQRLDVPNVIKVNWGIVNFKKEYKDRFINQRAQSNVHLKYAIEQGRVGITTSSEWESEMYNQGGRLPFSFDEKARWKIMSKEDMKQIENLPSPDIWDTFAFAFLESATYIQADGSGGSDNGGRKASARSKARESLGLAA